MKYLTPIVLTVLYVAAVALCGEAGQSSRVASQVCIPSEPVALSDLQPVKASGFIAVEWHNKALSSITVLHDGNVRAGFYEEVKIKGGKLASGTPSLPPRPGSCRTEVILNGPHATIKCHSNNCTTACGLYSTVTPNGESFYCECNYGPLPSPGPNPKPD